MKRILALSPADYGDVRIVKIMSYLNTKGYKIELVGWQRTEKEIKSSPLFERIHTILKGGGYQTKWTPVFYVIYIVKLFFYLLFKRNLQTYIPYAINFETACSIWLVSKFRKVKYVYDIFDECAISHNFSPRMMKFIRNVDSKIRKGAAFYIHVDENRVSDIDSENYVVIYNSPVDVKKSNETPEFDNKFAVTGWLNKTRGLQSIYEFAKANPQITFIVAGEFNQKEYEEKFLSLQNVDYHHFMPQADLFKLIGNCRGIFSLYDSSIPINRLAASNKLYDAMMLSIPVIVNKDLVAADFVRDNNTGYVVDYEYNETWNCLSTFNKDEVRQYGLNGRKVYKDRFEFNSMLDNVLLPKIEELGE